VRFIAEAGVPLHITASNQGPTSTLPTCCPPLTPRARLELNDPPILLTDHCDFTSGSSVHTIGVSLPVLGSLAHPLMYVYPSDVETPVAKLWE
jgi:hypothetical protein